MLRCHKTDNACNMPKPHEKCQTWTKCSTKCLKNTLPMMQKGTLGRVTSSVPWIHQPIPVCTVQKSSIFAKETKTETPRYQLCHHNKKSLLKLGRPEEKCKASNNSFATTTMQIKQSMQRVGQPESDANGRPGTQRCPEP